MVELFRWIPMIDDGYCRFHIRDFSTIFIHSFILLHEANLCSSEEEKENHLMDQTKTKHKRNIPHRQHTAPRLPSKVQQNIYADLLSHPAPQPPNEQGQKSSWA